MIKKIINIIVAAICVLLCLVACRQNNAQLPFAVDQTEVAVQSEGGGFNIMLSSSQAWTAECDNPWISVSPANGPASAECVVRVDSTVSSTVRQGLIRFHNRVTGDDLDVKVSQDGYGYNIYTSEEKINIKHFDYAEDRKFEVKVRSNVPFDVVIPVTARKWLSCELPEFNFDRGARPREVTLKFSWGVNSIPLERECEVELQPRGSWEGAKVCRFSVAQNAAPEIAIGHDGDSLAIMSLARSIVLTQEIPSGESMSNWDIVKMWEETDPGYTPEKKGRVRAVTFNMFSTTEGIPYEVQYLTEVEELTFFSNVNSFLYNMDPGEYICKLENLRKLTISAYGLSQLPEEFTNLRKLEWLDISSNNFASIPSVLTPENFPNLHALLINTCQRGYILDLSNTVHKDLAGLKGPFPRRLLEWEKLDTLRLSVNYLEGEMPDMLDYDVKYTEEDCQKMNLPPALVGTPKVLPNAKYFAFNLNRLYGNLPDWVLYHPNLTSWGPYALCYPQEGRASNGTAAFFNNVPVNLDYYWDFYKGYKEHEDIYIGD